ncbi:MAG TPA: hypothetical protein VGJ84_17255 [Polyangiaceae bacterium]|jgi:hypothetical protein
MSPQDVRLLQALRDKANKAEAKLEALSELLDDLDLTAVRKPDGALMWPSEQVVLVFGEHLERRKREADEAVGELVQVVKRELRGRPS